MALAQCQAVALRSQRAARVQVQHAEEQDGEDIGDREVPADMADAGCSDGPHDFAA